MVQGVKFLFFPILWPASYFLLFFHEIPSFSYFFRVLLGTQKHFEIFEIKLPVKLINSTKNWNFMSKKDQFEAFRVISSETRAQTFSVLLIVDVQKPWLAFIVRKTYIWWQWTLILFQFVKKIIVAYHSHSFKGLINHHLVKYLMKFGIW